MVTRKLNAKSPKININKLFNILDIIRTIYKKTVPRMEHRFAFYEYERIYLLDTMALEVKTLSVFLNEEFLVIEAEARLLDAFSIKFNRHTNCGSSLMRARRFNVRSRAGRSDHR